MPEVIFAPIPLEETTKRVGKFSRFSRVIFGRWVVRVGVVVMLIFVLIAIFAPWVAPYNPDIQNLRAALEPPSKLHLLGTDQLGRDLLSRIIYGSRISLIVGVIAVTIGGAIGITLGLLAGYYKGLINTVIMRFMDAILALPPLVLMLAIAAALGGGLINILIAIGVGMTPTYCRLMCSQVLSIKENDYITAAHMMGASDLRIMVSHLLPNAFPPLLVLITMNLGTAILMEASLSFLGIGIRPPTASWGAMVSSSYMYLLSNPLLSLAPGIAILFIVLAFNIVGDGLRDALDPRLRGRL